MTNLEAALKYLSKRWPVFPVTPDTKKPCLESWKEYQNRLPTEAEIEKWWIDWPWANIALATGKFAGVSVVDVDPRHEGSIEGLSDTVKAQTGGGGWHYFYKYSAGCHSQNGIVTGIDLKSDGGYVILAPSTHASGNKYKWITPPFVNDFTELPEQFLNNSRDSKFDPEILRGVPEGKRNESAASVVGKLLGKFPENEWEATCWDLVKGWNLKNEPPLDEKELWIIFQSIASKERRSRKIQGTIEISKPLWPKAIAEEAFVGLAGDIIKAIEPHSESDPAALLMSFLTGFGSIIGDKPHFRVEGDRHPGRLFTVLVGQTAKARKGTSWGHLRNILVGLDEEWGNNIQSGLSSGEGLVWAVRDPIEKPSDPGVEDKRCLVVEGELARTLKAIERDGNTLSAVIRSAWDSGNLKILTKNSPAKATGAHISIIGHITAEELNRQLGSNETVNGFGNRILWCCVKRSKILPRGGNISNVDLGPLINRLRAAILFARTIEEVTWAEGTIPLWDFIYPELSEGEPGLVGSMTARSEAYVIRLALIYALLDKSKVIKPDHLKAALAVWDYCEASVRYIFQGKADDHLADKILEALKDNPDGVTRTDINNLFGRNINSEQLASPLRALLKTGQIKSESIQTEGRTKELFSLNSSNSFTTTQKTYLEKIEEYTVEADDLGTNNSSQDYEKNELTTQDSEETKKSAEEGGKYDWL